MTALTNPSADAPSEEVVPIVSILVVDDNAAKRLALKAVLAPLKYSVVEAVSGLDALRCVLAQDFAVILLDVRMPNMDGFETAARIRQRKRSEMTPIIFITAFKDDELVTAERYSQSAVDFIFAPVEPAVLRAKVSVFAKMFIEAATLATRAKALEITASQLRLLTDALPIGVFQTDINNRYLYTNPRWSAITGIDREDAVGREWHFLFESGERLDVISELSVTELRPGEFCNRFEISRPGSTPRVILVTSVPVPDEKDGSAGWVGTVVEEAVEAVADPTPAKRKPRRSSSSKNPLDASGPEILRPARAGSAGNGQALSRKPQAERLSRRSGHSPAA
jgi:PAS domain S-box-containing protein